MRAAARPVRPDPEERGHVGSICSIWMPRCSTNGEFSSQPRARAPPRVSPAAIVRLYSAPRLHALPFPPWPRPRGPSPRSALPPSRRRASWRPPLPRPRTPRWSGSRSCSASARARSSRRTPRDLADERAAGLTDALRDRLALDRGAGRRDGRRGARDRRAARPGRRGDRASAPSRAALSMRKVRVPLGVVAVVYEARPNVTVDCAALTLKSGNAIVLRGSSYAARSNAALAAIVREAVSRGRPARGIGRAARRRGDRAELAELATAGGPRGPDHPAGRRGAEGGAEGGRRRCR